MSDPDLREAKAALEKLSQDPAARRLAEERERAAWNLRYSMAQERKEGREEGRVAGREEGRVAGREEGRVAGREEALREAVEHLCQALAVPVSDQQRADLGASTAEALQAILDHVALHRKWPA